MISGVVDLIEHVNVILGESLESDLTCPGDINSESIINVIDIIDLVNYILE